MNIEISIYLLFVFIAVFLSNTNIVGLILILSYTQGVLEIFLNIYPENSRLLVELLIIILFIRLLMAGRKIKIYAPILILIFIFTTLISELYNNSGIIPYLFFIRRYLLYFVFFMIIQSINLTQKNIQNLYYLLFGLFIIQIPAINIKYILIGQSEKGAIGTVSVLGGSISTMLPLVATAFLTAYYFYERSKISIILILCYLFFGIVGAKRAIAFYIPILIVIVYYFYDQKKGIKTLISGFKAKYIFAAVILLPLAFYVVARLSPTLNPQNIVGGEFDLSYAMDYVVSYETRGENGADGTGRFVSAYILYDYFENVGIEKILFGLGPGIFLESKFMNTGPDILYNKLGFGYGISMIPFYTTLLQIGIIGTLIFVFIHIKLFRSIFKIYKHSSDKSISILSLGQSAVIIIFFIDFFTYSPSMLIALPLTIPYYFISATILSYSSINLGYFRGLAKK